MITHRGSIIRAVVFGSVAAAALIWVYSSMNEQRGGGSVEVQQVPGPSWGVQIQEMPSDAAPAPADTRSGRVVAEETRPAD
jgi:hypothetical protein